MQKSSCDSLNQKSDALDMKEIKQFPSDRLYMEGTNSIRDRSSHWMYPIEKDVLKHFEKFTVKHLCMSLFFKKSAEVSF